ncbi:MAG: hypothetical protein J7647_30435 [Cyanobacteria bacterium SBLK]|nr:hypothetical protein [Cyanobacteria bacterium SBLK]
MKDVKKVVSNCVFVLLLLNLLSLGVYHLCNTPEEQARLERLTALEEPLALIVADKSQKRASQF